jgi:hypothetical protein
MSATTTLNKVKAVLGLEVNLEQMKLDNGTIVEAESFAKGESIFIVTEDDKVALPKGEYEMEDGKKLVIEEDGVIAMIGEQEEAEKEEVEKEKHQEDELDANLEDHPKEEKMEEFVSKEEFYTALEEIKQMIEKMTITEEKMSEQTEEVEAEVENAEVESDAINEEVTEQEELKEELSKPATEPLKHAPKEESAFKAKFKFNTNKNITAYDRIVSKILNIKQQ